MRSSSSSVWAGVRWWAMAVVTDGCCHLLWLMQYSKTAPPWAYTALTLTSWTQCSRELLYSSHRDGDTLSRVRWMSVCLNNRVKCRSRKYYTTMSNVKGMSMTYSVKSERERWNITWSKFYGSVLSISLLPNNYRSIGHPCRLDCLCVLSKYGDWMK